MIDNLDLLLRELHKAVENNNCNSLKKCIIISLQSKESEMSYTIFPYEVKYNTSGFYILDNKQNYFLIREPDNFYLTKDGTNNCLQFSFRNKSTGEYYGICF